MIDNYSLLNGDIFAFKDAGPKPLSSCLDAS